ncbi:metallophosphoesterase family protein [Sphingobacterium athyrii]|uniref:Calcineurin-like phosphoesterase domain-containing protein n=1 Tax=Sphingobacterium athyrii TaxID=2152717 RepID=A0A363NWF8_9SPHI|nr:metallophosphoesterase [Sphingobacterium athyrii]PUV25152.1 hypothetical protein DCO56_09440 [Sphingobacterium athyrii]
MRIVHISDIHLSESNFDVFETDYIKALLKTLKEEHDQDPIDIIAITGDLVDQGGHSLFKIEKFKGKTDPYEIFEDEFITPIKNHLKLNNANFLFIPGNHDIDENEIKWVDEKKLKKIEADGDINSILKDIRLDSHEKFSYRIKQFKDFEKRFHKESIGTTYQFTRNQSTYIYEVNKDIKVGFALINDSWRCSTCELQAYFGNGLYFGYKQLNDALNLLAGTTMNIVMTHHPIESYAEKEDIQAILTHKDYHLHLFGDKHHHQLRRLISSSGGCFGIMARSALNKPKEPESKWQPGFHIITINFQEACLEEILYYKYLPFQFCFTNDGEIAPKDGRDVSKHPLGFTPFITEVNNSETSEDGNLEDQIMENYIKDVK